MAIDYTKFSEEELVQMHTEIGGIIEARKKARNAVIIERIQKELAAAGLAPQDLVVPGQGGVSRSRRRGSGALAKNRLLPALQAILKNGPITQDVLRQRLMTEFGIPLHEINVMSRYGYVVINESGQYELGPEGRIQSAPEGRVQ